MAYEFPPLPYPKAPSNRTSTRKRWRYITATSQSFTSRISQSHRWQSRSRIEDRRTIDQQHGRGAQDIRNVVRTTPAARESFDVLEVDGPEAGGAPSGKLGDDITPPSAASMRSGKL